MANFGLALYPERTETGCGGDGGDGPQRLVVADHSARPSTPANLMSAGWPTSSGVTSRVIRMLDQAKAMGILEAVQDESHFWDNRDVKGSGCPNGWAMERPHRRVWSGNTTTGLAAYFSAPITEYPNFEHLEAEGRGGKRDEQLHRN